jgi:hypothetical protein
MANKEALDTIVRNFCGRQGDNYSHEYGKVYSLMVDCVKELWYDIVGQYGIKETEIEVVDGRAYFPRDYIKYVLIGTVEKGNLIALTMNPHMYTSGLDDCGNPVRSAGGDPQKTDQSDNYADDYIWGRWYYAERGAQAYGGGWSNRDAYYKVNENGEYLDVNSDFPYDTVILRYLSSGYNPGEITMVPSFFTQALIKYARWQIAEDGSDREYARAGNYKREYTIEKVRAWDRANAEPMYEMIAAQRQSFGFYPKY